MNSSRVSACGAAKRTGSHYIYKYINIYIYIYKTIPWIRYSIIILPAVFYGCETWSLTSREELRLRVFENKVLRRIFGPKRDEVTGGCRETI